MTVSGVFLGFVNRSVTAGWLVLAVLALRLVLRRAPRRFHCLLWAAVAVRLVLPFSIQSPVSLIPTTQTVVPETVYSGHPTLQTGIPAVNSQLAAYIGSHYYEGVTVPADTAARLTDVLSALWLAGVAALLVYCVGTWLHMRFRLHTAVRLRDDLWQSEWVDSPFVLGLFRPRIYLPFRLDEGTLSQVEAHERAHIARGDHVWKVLAFALLALHWFHPLLWAAYLLFCRDLEYACDERVISHLDAEGRRRYSDALLRCAAPRRSVAPCPVAFGESGVGGRIRNVLRYRKPAFWVALAAALALIVTAVCFLTDPPVKDSAQWLHTRRPSQLADCELLVNHGGAGLTSYTRPLSQRQREDLSRLLRSVPDSQLTTGMSLVGAPDGWSLYLPRGQVYLSLPEGADDGDRVLLIYRAQETWIRDRALADYLRQLLPGPMLTWRCPYENGRPLSSLTISPALACDRLEISYFTGSFAGGTDPRWQDHSDDAAALEAGTVTLGPGEAAVWTPGVLDEDFPQSDSFDLTWFYDAGKFSDRRATLVVSPRPVTDGGTVTAVDYRITVLSGSVPLEYTLADDTLLLTPSYPAINGFPFNDFYGSLRWDVDGDGDVEYCTLGVGPTSGLFTFTFAAQADGQVKYASIFQTEWYDLSFVYLNGVPVVRGVTQDGQEHFFRIRVRNGELILLENGQDLPRWSGAPSQP